MSWGCRLDNEITRLRSSRLDVIHDDFTTADLSYLVKVKEHIATLTMPWTW